MEYKYDDRVEDNKPCPHCQAEPGERHREWDDIARCRSTGNQLIQCGGEEHEYNGRWYGDHDGPCGPDIWDGEWPGTKQCRELGWFKEMSIFHTGEKYMGADLNRLISSATGWDPQTERYVLK